MLSAMDLILNCGTKYCRKKKAFRRPRVDAELRGKKELQFVADEYVDHQNEDNLTELAGKGRSIVGGNGRGLT